MPICSNEGKRERQGHYSDKIKENAKIVERKKSLYLTKPLVDAPNGALTHLKFQHAST